MNRPGLAAQGLHAKPSSETYVYLKPISPAAPSQIQSATPSLPRKAGTSSPKPRYSRPGRPPASRLRTAGREPRAAAARDAQPPASRPGCHHRATAGTVGVASIRGWLRAYSPSLAGSERPGSGCASRCGSGFGCLALRCALRSDGAASCRGGARGLGAQARGRDPPRTNTEARGLWARGAAANQTRRPNSLAPAGFLTRSVPERRSPRLPVMLVDPGARARSSNSACLD